MNRLLVALDNSDRAPLVLSAAVALARAMGAKLRLFRAIPVQPEIPWDMIHRFPPGGLEQVLVEQAQAELQERARDVPPDVFDGVATAIGTIWSSICEAARLYDAQLIVVGSHGYGALDHVVGTTAARVVNHADRSVLVVRAPI